MDSIKELMKNIFIEPWRILTGSYDDLEGFGLNHWLLPLAIIFYLPFVLLCFIATGMGSDNG